MLENNKLYHSLPWEIWQQIMPIAIDWGIRNATRSSTGLFPFGTSALTAARPRAQVFPFLPFFLHFYLRAFPFLLCCSFLSLTCYKVIALSNKHRLHQVRYHSSKTKGLRKERE